MRLLFFDEIQPGCEGSPVLAARSVALGKTSHGWREKPCGRSVFRRDPPLFCCRSLESSSYERRRDDDNRERVDV